MNVRPSPSRSLAVLFCRTDIERLLRRPWVGPLTGRLRRGAVPAGTAGREAGQATVEYALVVLAAAGLALLAIAWAARTGRIGELFDRVFDRVLAGTG